MEALPLCREGLVSLSFFPRDCNIDAHLISRLETDFIVNTLNSFSWSSTFSSSEGEGCFSRTRSQVGSPILSMRREIGYNCLSVWNPIILKKKKKTLCIPLLPLFSLFRLSLLLPLLSRLHHLPDLIQRIKSSSLVKVIQVSSIV